MRARMQRSSATSANTASIPQAAMSVALMANDKSRFAALRQKRVDDLHAWVAERVCTCRMRRAVTY